MRSFFKKPTWATTDKSAKPSAFYKHADTLYDDIIRQEKEKSGKGKQEGSEVKQENGPSTPRRDLKRPANDDSDTEDGTDVKEVEVEFVKNEAATPQRQAPANVTPKRNPQRSPEQSAATPQSNRRRPSVSQKKPRLNYIPTPPRLAKFTNSITIDSDSSDPISPKVNRTMAHTSPLTGSGPELLAKVEADEQKAITISSDEDTEEDEFPELRRRARERARLAAEARKAQSKAQTQAQTVDGESPRTPSKQLARSTQTPNTSSGEADPNVEILITSEIPGTKPLLVLRRLTQNLKEVRKFWCSRQEFPPEMSDSIFLIWNGKRVFDVTTCKSLGVDTMEEEDDPFDDPRDEGCQFRVHMEAVTEELFEELREIAAQSLANNESTEDQDDGDEEDNGEEPEQLIRIILQGPDFEELRMRVRPVTVVANIAQAVRRARGIPAEKTIHILFDGENLDPGLVVGDSEMCDMDRLDVLIK